MPAKRWQRLFRIVRLALGLACFFTEFAHARFSLNESTLLFAAYTLYALVSLLFKGLEDTSYRLLALAIDTVFFFLIAGSAASYAYWVAAVFYAFLLLVSAVLYDGWKAVAITAGAISFLNFLQPPHFSVLLPGLVCAGIVGSALAFEHDYLSEHADAASRQSLLHRHEAHKARESERQRIAGDFHDGPLQSFIAFHMRLEVIRRLLERDVARARNELEQLQHTSKAQVNELRTFVRSMRPVEVEGSLNAAVRRVVDQFQKDSGIAASFATSEFAELAEPDRSVEIVQIVREALYNVQKHASATRVAVSLQRTADALEVSIEDNGHGFPFSGRYSLEELEALRLGPNSIERRVRALAAQMTLESKPGQGSVLRIRV